MLLLRLAQACGCDQQHIVHIVDWIILLKICIILIFAASQTERQVERDTSLLKRKPAFPLKVITLRGKDVRYLI